jgi:putative Mn2+ efflux pump MntP
MVALILSLGLDTLIISVSLGFVKREGKLTIACVFACAEALMPLIGVLIGKGSGHFVGSWSSLIGGILLLAVAVWLIFFEDEDGEEEKLERNLVGWTLIVTALSISLDELAVGFSIGFIHVPIVLTIVLIAVQAFLFTMIGLLFGARIKPLLGEWSEKLAGIVLGLLGLWILGESVVRLMHR